MPFTATPIKASVVMITYNHEQFIEQAVRGVMMQEADFSFELVIGDDYSTDRTREILLRLNDEFPDRITLLLHAKNIGMMANFASVFNACQGQYIALCEGDDYWTSPLKLQTQTRYLDSHPDCRMCFHQAAVFDEETQAIVRLSSVPSHTSVDVKTLFGSTDITTASVMLRKPTAPLANWLTDLQYAGDWGFFYWLWMQGGDFRFLDSQVMSAYRLHRGGVSYQPDYLALRKKRLSALHDIYLVIDKLNDIQHKRSLFLLAMREHQILSGGYLHERNFHMARKHAWQCLQYAIKGHSKRVIGLKILFVAYFPGIYRRLRSADI